MSEIIKENDRIVVRPGRDIVGSMAEEFKTELKELLAGEEAGLVMDLDGVQLVDSMGLGVLIAAHNSLQKKNARLELTNISEDILGLLKNMRLDQHFKIL